MATIAEVKDFMTDRSAANRAVKKDVDTLLQEKVSDIQNEGVRDELHRLRLEIGLMKDSIQWLGHEMRILFSTLYERRQAVDDYCESYRENVLPERMRETVPRPRAEEFRTERGPDLPAMAAPQPEPEPPQPPARRRAEHKGEKKWITNGIDSKKIPSGEAIPAGWIPGRANAFGKEKRMDIADRAKEEQEAFQASALAEHFNQRRLDAPVQNEPVICIDCEKPIHPERLRYVKNAVRCARCQREHEELFK